MCVAKSEFLFMPACLCSIMLLDKRKISLAPIYISQHINKNDMFKTILKIIAHFKSIFSGSKKQVFFHPHCFLNKRSKCFCRREPAFPCRQNGKLEGMSCHAICRRSR